jgi:hypothetical protein
VNVYDRIADSAIKQAEEVELPFEAFVEGLESIMIAVRERWELAKDELRHRQKENE